jgi:hypothetical protein
MNALRWNHLSQGSTRRAALVGLIGLIGLVASWPAQAQELLQNPSFEVGGAAISFTGVGEGSSAATYWTVWNQFPATTQTDLEATSCPGGGARMIHVRTTATHSGLVQVFLPYNTGPHQVVCGVWVKVLHGQVGIGAGNGGNTSLTGFSNPSLTGWQYLQTTNGNSPANEFIIYASSSGAEFYADLASVHVPFPDAKGTYSGLFRDVQPEGIGYIGGTLTIQSETPSSQGDVAAITGTLTQDGPPAYAYAGTLDRMGNIKIHITVDCQEYIYLQGVVRFSTVSTTWWLKEITGTWGDVYNGFTFAGGPFLLRSPR